MSCATGYKCFKKQINTMECSIFALAYSSVNYCIRFNNLSKNEKGFYTNSRRLYTNRMSYLNVACGFCYHCLL